MFCPSYIYTNITLELFINMAQIGATKPIDNTVLFRMLNRIGLCTDPEPDPTLLPRVHLIRFVHTSHMEGPIS